MSDAEARLRSALAAAAPIDPADVAAVLALLEEARATAEARWDAIGRLAPAAKANRGKAQDAARLLAELASALRQPLDDDARQRWIERIDRGA